MTYKLQPGTIPYKAVAWLRSMAKCSPGRWSSTVEICDGIGLDTTQEFTSCMWAPLAHGMVKNRRIPGERSLQWIAGDGKPLATEPREQDEPLHPAPTPRHGPLLPAAAPPPSFRALEWDGHVLATGMTIKDGVAIFTPEQVLALKRTTEQMQPA